MRTGLGALLIFAVATLIAASSAHAAEFMWCVDGSGAVAFFDCADGLTCAADSTGQDVFRTVAEALAEARIAGTEDDVHHVCVSTEPTHVEDIVIDNADGGLGTEVHLRFAAGGQDDCPATSGAAAVGSSAIERGVGDHRLSC